MRHEVVSMRIYCRTGPDYRVRALKVGEWCAHLIVDFDGVSVSHISGVTVSYGLPPVAAVRLLRALQAMPPCPLDGALVVTMAREKRMRKNLAMCEWLDQLKVIVEGVTEIRI